MPLDRLRPTLRQFVACLAVFALLLPSGLLAGEAAVRLQLVWGTDGAPPEGKELPKLEPELQRKFLRHLRWKNYFVVKSESKTVPAKGTQTAALSKRCTVELEIVNEDQMQVRIYGVDGEGKVRLVDSKMQSVSKLQQGHVFVYGGESRDNWDDAWLVVITSVP